MCFLDIYPIVFPCFARKFAWNRSEFSLFYETTNSVITFGRIYDSAINSKSFQHRIYLVYFLLILQLVR